MFFGVVCRVGKERVGMTGLTVLGDTNVNAGLGFRACGTGLDLGRYVHSLQFRASDAPSKKLKVVGLGRRESGMQRVLPSSRWRITEP